MNEDPTVEIPILEAHQRREHAERRLERWERFGWVLRVATTVIVAALLGMNVYLAIALADKGDVINRIEEGQRLDRCETLRIGEYLATFSDYLGVTPGDPYRRDLDDHLKRVANQLRTRGEVCAPIPPAPTSTSSTTTTTTTEPPPVPTRGSSQAFPTPIPTAAVPTTTRPGKRLGQTK